ncbi:MAG: zinc ribbon domain-containing protein, partial [Promethearchaeota archaeon]
KKSIYQMQIIDYLFGLKKSVFIASIPNQRLKALKLLASVPRKKKRKRGRKKDILKSFYKISVNTINLLRNDNFKKASLKSLLGRGTLSDDSLKILQKLLKRNIFGELQLKSIEEIKNHIGQLKNLLITSKVLDIPLEGAINALRGDQSNRDNFCKLVLESFTKIVDNEKTAIPPEEFSQYFAKRYFANFKRQTKDLALRKLNLGEPLKQNYFTAQFVNGLVFGDIAGFKNISEFIKLRDKHIAAMKNNNNFSNRVETITTPILLAKVRELTSSYLEDLIEKIGEEPKPSLTKILFKPRASKFFYNSLDEEGFEEFIDHLLKNKIKENFFELCLSDDILTTSINFLNNLNSSKTPNIYNIAPIPKMRKLTIRLHSDQALYDFYEPDLVARLKFVFGRTDELFVLKNNIHNNNNIRTKKEVKKEKRIRSLFNNYNRTPPTLKLVGNKVLACQAFYTQKVGTTPDLHDLGQQQQSVYRGYEDLGRTMGVDVGLKTFSAASIWGKEQKEIARYLLGHKVLYNSKLNSDTGKFESTHPLLWLYAENPKNRNIDVFTTKISERVKNLCDNLGVTYLSEFENAIKNIVWGLYNDIRDEYRTILDKVDVLTFAGIIIVILSQIRAFKGNKISFGTKKVFRAIFHANSINLSEEDFDKLYSAFLQQQQKNKNSLLKSEVKNSSFNPAEIFQTISSSGEISQGQFDKLCFSFERYYSMVQQKFAGSFNVKHELVKLRKEIVRVQSSLNYLQSHGKTNSRRAYILSRSLFYLWKKINNLHSDIIQRNSIFLLKIVIKHGVPIVKFEDLSWSKHTPKRKSPYLAFWQVHWFFSQLQAHATQLLERHGIKVQLVDARDTSQICSECRRLKDPNFADKIGTVRSPSNSKLFTCSNLIYHKKIFRIDADLNAARNIALSPPLDSYQSNNFQDTPSPALV